MKKFLTLLTTAALAITFVSCNNKDKNVPATGVTLTNTLDTLALGQTLQLQHAVQPHDATNQSVSWMSSSDANATVVDGTVTALRLGSATITVTTQDGNFTDISQILVSNAKNQFCNMLTPGWGSSLGTVTRGSETTITGHGITQIWSDAVTATNCQKTIFNGSTSDSENSNFNADCRSNPDYPGDLFSWCAVIRFQDQLCPAPWRVPTMQDFINLDIALGGNGNNRGAWTSDIATLQFVTDNYINRWGGAFGGNCLPAGSLNGQDFFAYYWSQTEGSATGGRGLHFNTNGLIWPQDSVDKSAGFSLRCVR